MSGRDTLGTDDKEPWRGGNHVTWKDLYQVVSEIKTDVSLMKSDISVIKEKFQNQEKAKNDTYKKAGIISATIGTIVAVIQRVWG